MASLRITLFLHLTGGLVDICSRDIRLLVPFTSELVGHWAFSSVCRGYSIGRRRLESYDDLEGTLAGNLTPLKIIGELGNVE